MDAGHKVPRIFATLVNINQMRAERGQCMLAKGGCVLREVDTERAVTIISGEVYSGPE